MAVRFEAIIAGRGTLLLRCAEEWITRGHRVVAAVTDDDAVAAWAVARAIPCSASPGESLPSCDYTFLIGFPDDQPGAWPTAPRKHVVAYQDSLLPSCAGWHATTWAILRGETTHGVTWYIPDAAGGTPLQRAEFPVAADETAFTLDAKCFDAAQATFAQLVSSLETGGASPLPALNRPASSFARHQRPPAACVLDFEEPVASLVALSRALDFGAHPNPVGLPKLWLGTDVVAVRRVEPVEDRQRAVAGTIVSITDDALVVATADGAVRLKNLVTVDGRPASPVALAARFDLAPGSRLPALTRSERAELTQLHELFAPTEPAWIRRIAAGEPFQLPLTTPVPLDATPAWTAMDVALPAGLTAMDIAALHAAFFLRIVDAEELDLEWREERRARAAAILSDALPLHVLAVRGESFDAFAARHSAAVAELRTLKGCLCDLRLRDPSLASLPRPPVRIAVGSSDQATVADTMLAVEISPDGKTCLWRGNERGLSAQHTRRLSKLFASFVNRIVADRTADWRAAPLLDAEESSQLAVALAPAATRYTTDKDLGDLVAGIAATQPDRVALVAGDRTLTYRELNARANQVASLLSTKGAGPDVRIGLFMERSVETLVALLGILKSGGAYVPLDPAYPRDRLHHMTTNADLAVVITQPHLRASLPDGVRHVVELDAAFGALAGFPETAVVSKATPDNLLYVIYTSGSTGLPKGVAMTRRAGLNLIAWQNTASTPTPNGRTFQYSSLSFDVSFQEIFSTWTAGGTLVLVPETARKDPMQLLDLADAAKVDRWFMPYAALQQVAVAAEASGRYPDALRDVVTAGEALRCTTEIRGFFRKLPTCRLHNQYGPSETHVATAQLLPPDIDAWPELPPIGRPIANTRILLLDSNRVPVPVGFPGELYIGGDCLARGYLNQPAMTEERFVTGATPGGSKERFYKTGDLGRLNAQGEIEFLGRRDDQVKIRGYRVELGEVEAALSRHPQVREAVVVARGVSGARQLVAYATVADASCDARVLKSHLQAILPEFMVPSAFVVLDRFPLTPSGKIHRRALPEPGHARTASSDYRPPQGDVERIVSHLWQQVLGLEKVGADDNFFDLGGDSLKLARVQAALRTSLRRDVPIVDLFRFPTVASLAAHLSAGDATAAAPRRRAHRSPGDDAIAVVGMAGRFPGAKNVDEFWANIRAGKESISFFTDDEIANKAPALAPGSNLKFVKARGVLEQCELFDASFFGYGPRDAELMDPQHRVFLECAYEALENAGCDPARFDGAIGVYASASLNSYLMYNVLAGRAAVHDLLTSFQVGGYQTIMGNDKDYVATRVAYKLNLRGPSLSIQTACSSSLVAICQACQSLAAGACDVALAGGVSITFPQKRGYMFIEGSIASSDGHCRPFDANATGTVFGSGVGLVVLKRLADAQADGDTVYGVIKGWALNNDGALKAGYMAPSVEGQAEVIRLAQEQARIDARTIGYVETHGTGTPLGDPIEIAGLTRAFRLSTADTGYCALGSAKANIGHLESAAGVTGLIKAVLALHHREIPPLTHFERPNPLIDLPGTPFYAPRELTPWTKGGTPRRAAVSSFGVGGTNAHVVLEEAPEASTNVVAKPAQLLLVSARTDTAVAASGAALAAFLEKQPDVSLDDVAYTLQTGRQVFEKRAFVVAASPAEAIAALRPANGLRGTKSTISGKPSVVFLFSGQGSQHVDMGRGLYESEPVFREHLDACAKILRPLLGMELTDLLYPDASKREECDRQLTQTKFAQPALFAIEYALARWWMAHGIKPAATIGHSAGEYVGACLAGVFSLEDVLAVIVKRASLMQALPPGRMLAVRMPEADVLPLLTKDLSLAAANSPQMSVVSGPAEAIDALNSTLEAKGVGGRVLQTSHAFHSAMMEPALEPFRQFLKGITLHAPSAPFLSTARGDWLAPGEVETAEYWVRQIREPVRFSRALAAFQNQPGTIFLEVGPNQALTTLTLQHDAPGAAITAIPSLRHTKETIGDYASLLRAVGRLWQNGCEIDWRSLRDGGASRRIALPTYPFERKRFWIEPPKTVDGEVIAPSTPDRESESAPAETADKGAKAAATSPKDAVLGDVLDILQDLSGIDRASIVPERPFLEMGFDSLFLTQVSLAFQRRFLVKLTLRQMLEDLSSPAAIATYIASQMPAAPAPATEAAQPDVDKLALTQAGPFGPEEEAAPKPAPLPVPTRHGPYSPINKAAGDALTTKQQQHLDDLIARYTKKTAKSKEYTQRNRAHFADPRAVAGFRVTWKEMTYPVVADHSAGSRIWDIDGNEFLDVTMGFGTNLFGHNPDFIRVALERQLGKGLEIGPQSAVAGEVARAICELIGMDRATFCNTGSEAVMGAVRAARTVTGKSKVVYFAGDYHGVHDEVLAKGQTVQGRTRTIPIAPGIPPESVSQVQVLAYGDPASLDWIKANANNIAAVLVEPVQSRKPELQPKEFLVALRDLTKRNGIAMIFDEVITGFRVHPGGAQAWYGIRADIATYGKIIGGGMPIGVIAGSHQYMDAFDGGAWQYGDASVPEAGVTFFAGTFVRHPLAMAAARAVLEHLRTAGPALQQSLNERTARYVGEVNAFLDAEGVDLRINHFGSLWYFSHGDGFKHFSLLFHVLRDLGIHIWEGRPCFLSTAHSDADIARLVGAFKSAITWLREGGFLPERERAIPPSGPFPLSEAQQEIWLATGLNPDAAPAFNESCSFTFTGSFDRNALAQALRRVVERHEALRTTVDAQGENQVVQAASTPELPFEDLSTRPAAERDARLAQLVRDEVQRPFDLSRSPLLRGRLVKVASDRHILILTAHHIVCDGWSYDVMARDLAALYTLARRGENDHRPLPAQFRDYARFMAAYRKDARYDVDLGYWMKSLASPPDAIRLPTDRTRPATRSFRGAMDVSVIDNPLCSAIKDLGARKRCTLFGTLLALYGVLLHRLTGQRDLVVGIPAAGQQLMEDQKIVGHCANLLPLRLRIDPERRFAEFLADAQKALLDAYEHQGITFGALLKALQVPRDPSRAPLIQVTFNVDPAIHGMDFDGVETEIVINPRTAYQFEHSFNVVAHADKLRIECNYNTDLFDESTVRRWAGCFRELARCVTQDPDLAIGAIPMLSEEERRLHLVDWNRTVAPYPEACIHELFEAEVRAKPDRIALSMSGRTWTYDELNKRANRLARRLVALGVGPDQLVGICADRSFNLVAGLLGILKAGGAYVPLDPAHPDDRIQHQLKDGAIGVVLADPAQAAKPALQGAKVVSLDGAGADWLDLPANDLQASERTSAHRPNQLAYVLYTSGSTGRPKGVLIEHKSVVRLVKGVDYVRLDPDERLILMSPLAFDASTFELWGSLLNGARLSILPPGPFSLDVLARSLQEERVSVMFITTSLFHKLVDENPGCLAMVRQVLTGGEVTSGKRIARLLQLRPDLRVVHVYGPTESTTFATAEVFTDPATVGDPPTLGRPIPNTQAYILGEGLALQPVGVPGELCLGGDGLARGYLNQAELTARQFVRNPFPGTPGDRLYRTGDLARRAPDGRIDFLGRLDEQVKVRGFRIEPGEIEAALSTFPGVQTSVAIVRPDAQGEKQLVAYVAMVPGTAAPKVDDLRAHLRRSMPDFMVPSIFSLQPSLPLTASGKVDRKALPDPLAGVIAATGGDFAAPTGDVEQMLQRLWSRILGMPRIGRKDDFFTMGGHSMAALTLINRLRDEGYVLEVADLFRNPTIEQMVHVLKPIERPRLAAEGNDTVVRLQDGRPGVPPLCLLPSDFGDLLIYSNLLPLLDPSLPVIGLQFAKMYEDDRGIASMPDLAKYFADALRRVQPHGPYMLAGYCFGGHVAIELAKHLTAQGEDVRLLALIDARPFNPKVERTEYLRMLIKGAFRATHADWKRHLSAKLAMRREGKLIDMMARTNPDQLGRRELNRWVLETRVLANYRSTDYDGHVTYFYPEESQYQLYGDPTCGWLYLANRVGLHKVTGSHVNMMKQPHVTLLAERLQACIRKATGEVTR